MSHPTLASVRVELREWKDDAFVLSGGCNCGYAFVDKVVVIISVNVSCRDSENFSEALELESVKAL